MSRANARRKAHGKRRVATDSTRQPVLPTTSADTFLLNMFRELYDEVILLKEQALTGAWVFTEPAEAEVVMPGVSPVILIQQPLLTLLKQQELEAARLGGSFGHELYKQAQYLMAALADEIFLNLAWEGREHWSACLLESALFNSNAAGELFFDRLDELLRKRDPLYANLTQIYLLALALGFQGKYRGSGDSSVLDRYRRRLFGFVYRRDPALGDSGQPLFSQAYAHTYTDSVPAMLPDVRRWYVAAAGLLALFLIVSHIAWNHLLNEGEPLVSEILDRSRFSNNF